MGRHYFAHPDESANDENTGFYGPLGIEDGSRHNGPVFRVSEWQDGREFQAGEVVTLCDNLLFLLSCYSKGEILRKPRRIAFYGLIQRPCGYPVKCRQIQVQNNAVSPDGEDPPGDVFLPKGRQQSVGFWFQVLDHAVENFNSCARFEMSASRCPLKTAGTRE